MTFNKFFIFLFSQSTLWVAELGDNICEYELVSWIPQSAIIIVGCEISEDLFYDCILFLVFDFRNPHCVLRNCGTKKLKCLLWNFFSTYAISIASCGSQMNKFQNLKKKDFHFSLLRIAECRLRKKKFERKI